MTFFSLSLKEEMRTKIPKIEELTFQSVFQPTDWSIIISKLGAFVSAACNSHFLVAHGHEQLAKKDLWCIGSTGR